MDKGEECYCPPELMDDFFEDFPLAGDDYSSWHAFDSQDADVKNKNSEIKNVTLGNDVRINSMDFKCNIPRIYEDNQCMQYVLSDEMKKNVSRDHKVFFKPTTSFSKTAPTFKCNDAVIGSTSNRGMSDVANDILNRNDLPVPHYTENNNFYFNTSETVEDSNNIEFSEFYYKINKPLLNRMKGLLPSKSILNEKSEEKISGNPTFLANKCKQTRRLNANRIKWGNPHYSHKLSHQVYYQYINTKNLISSVEMGSPIVLRNSFIDSIVIPLCGTNNLNTKTPFVYFNGYKPMAAYNTDINNENTLQDIKLTEFQLRDEHPLKSESDVKMGDSDFQKYEMCNTKNKLLISSIEIQKKREKYLKCILQYGINDYEATVKHSLAKCQCFNHKISTNTKSSHVKQKNLDKRLKELALIHNSNKSIKFNTEMQNILGVILKTFQNNFQSYIVNFFNMVPVINATSNTINISNPSHQRKGEIKTVVNICNSNSDEIFAYLQETEFSSEYIQLQHKLYANSLSYHAISFPVDSHDNIHKQKVSCGTNSTESDIVVDHDLMNMVEKEVDLSVEQYENRFLLLPQNNPPKEVECQTDLSLNCKRIYKYQLSDSSDTFNILDSYQVPVLKRDNVEVLVDDTIPTKRRCGTDVSEYQEVDTVKWKIERYLSNNVLPADETNQIVPSSAVDEEKYEFNTMEIYSEMGVLKGKKDINTYRVCTYNLNETNSVKVANENTTSQKCLNSTTNRRPLRLGLSKRANTKRLHYHLLGQH